MRTAVPQTSCGRISRRALLATAAALACVVALVVLSARSRSPAAVDAELARLGAAGFPTTLAEVFGVPEPGTDAAGADARASRARDGDDAAAGAPAAPAADPHNGFDDVIAAFAWLEAKSGTFGNWTVTGPWDSALDGFPDAATPEQLTALAEFLAAARPFFDQVDAGLAKPVYRLPLEIERFSGLRAVAVTRQQHLIQILSARAAAAGSAEERLAGISAAARLGDRLEPRSPLVLMLALSARSVAISEARRAAESGSIPAGDLRCALDPALTQSVLPRLPAAARGEPAHLAYFWRTAVAGTSPAFPKRPLWRRFVRGLQRTFGGDDPREWYDLYPEEIAEAMRFWADVASIDASSPVALRAAADDLDSRRPVGADEVTRIFRMLTERILRHESASRLARVALAAKAHREATGAWPASLDALAPSLGGAVPTDPANDTPFGYESDGARVRFRAAGEGDADDATRRERLLLWEFPR